MKTFLFVLLLAGSAFAADSVAFSRTGGVLTVTVTVDVADIIAGNAADKKAHALNRALQALRAASESTKTNAELDAEAAAKKAVIDAELARLKRLKPTGSL